MERRVALRKPGAAAGEAVQQQRPVRVAVQIIRVRQPEAHHRQHLLHRLRPLLRRLRRLGALQRRMSLRRPPRLFTADGQLVQRQHTGVVQRGEIPIRLLELPPLDLHGGGVVRNGVQQLLLAQRLRQPSRGGVVGAHTLYIPAVAVATPHVRPAQQHQPRRAVPCRQIVAGLQMLHRVLVASRLIRGHADAPVAEGVGQQCQRLVPPPLQKPLHGQLPRGHARLQPGVQRPAVRVELPQQEEIRPRGGGAVRLVGGRRQRGGQLPKPPGEQPLIAVLRTARPRRLQRRVGVQTQPRQKQPQHIGGGLCLPRLDLGEVGHRADVLAESRLTPRVCQTLAQDQIAVIAHAPSSRIPCFLQYSRAQRFRQAPKTALGVFPHSVTAPPS